MLEYNRNITNQIKSFKLVIKLLNLRRDNNKMSKTKSF